MITIAAVTFLAEAGPALATVSAQLPVPPGVRLAGQCGTAEMFALVDALVTVTAPGRRRP